MVIAQSWLWDSQKTAECLVRFKPGTFWFYLKYLNPLDHTPQTVTLGHLILMRKKKYAKKSALTTSPITILNLVNSPKQPMHAKDFWNFKRDHRQDVLKETMKKLTFPLHPVAIYGQDHEKQRRCATSYLSLFELQNV